MFLIENIIEAINKEKHIDRTKSLFLVVALSAAVGAITALIIAQKSEGINKSINKFTEKALKTLEKGKGKVDEFVQDSKDKFAEGKDTFAAVRNDIMDSNDNLLDIKANIKEKLKG